MTSLFFWWIKLKWKSKSRDTAREGILHAWNQFASPERKWAVKSSWKNQSQFSGVLSGCSSLNRCLTVIPPVDRGTNIDATFLCCCQELLIVSKMAAISITGVEWLFLINSMWHYFLPIYLFGITCNTFVEYILYIPYEKDTSCNARIYRLANNSKSLNNYYWWVSHTTTELVGNKFTEKLLP